MKRIVWLLSCLCLSAPLFAQAQDAYVAADISLQAGPDTEYPSITELAAGTPVSIQGCVDGYTWCDVVAGDDRGWVPGSFLEEDFDNQRVIVVDYGPRIRIPVVTFSLGVYWGQHYHNRPWFGERERWESRRIQPRAVPKPAAVASGPHEERRARGDRGNVRGGTQPNATPAAQPAATPTPAPAPKTTLAPRTEPLAHPANEATPRPHAGPQEQKHEPRAPATATPPPPQPKTAAPPAAQHEAEHTAPPPHAAAPPKQPPSKAEPKKEPKEPAKKDEGDKKGGDAKDHN